MDNSIKTRLINLLQQGREGERAFAAGMSEMERAELGTSQDWPAKAVLMHIALWRGRLAGRLAAWQRGEPLPELLNEDAVNAQDWERYSSCTWDQAVDEGDRSLSRMVAAIRGLSGEQLGETIPTLWDPDRPVLRSIVGNSYVHPMSHMAAYHIRKGRPEQARRLMEEMNGPLVEFDPSDANRGEALYNLACICALTGEPDRAIELLRDAFPLRKGLVEWSKKDPDLALLRDRPAFQALYE